MATRNARYWRRFLHDLLQSGSAPDASYDGVCFFSLSGRVEFRDGCFLASSARALAVDPLQLLSIFEQLTRQAVQEERAAHEQQQQSEEAAKRLPQSLTPALRLGGDCVFHVVSASFSSVCALSSGQARGLVAEKLPFGVLVVAFSAPLSLQTVFARVDRACAALRQQQRQFSTCRGTGGRKENKEEKRVMYFCGACKLYVKDSSVAEHDQSTAHLLSSSNGVSVRKVWLPETNRGYQMLKSMGWRESG